jgi:hypothetical protein
MNNNKFFNGLTNPKKYKNDQVFQVAFSRYMLFSNYLEDFLPQPQPLFFLTAFGFALCVLTGAEAFFQELFIIVITPQLIFLSSLIPHIMHVFTACAL